jgi:ubiquinone/menaquinone biosynthesis C-methylase UbiE
MTAETRGKRDFDKAAETWDEQPAHLRRAHAIAEAIQRQVALSPDIRAMDYGAGPGLLTLEIRPRVRSVTAADSSPGMLSVLKRKVAERGITNVSTLLLDLEKEPGPERAFDLIVSSMVLHHVEDTARILGEFHRMLAPGGILAVADLDAEDGTFHTDKTGVQHFGFDRRRLKELLEKAGFTGIEAVTAVTIPREIAPGTVRSYPVFLVTARKPADL